MKILTISDSFKGTLSSEDVGKTSTDFFLSKGFDASYRVISDGGEGFLAAIQKNMGFPSYDVKSVDAFFRPRVGHYLYDKTSGTLYTELADICGITLIKEEEKNPYLASSFGLGEIIHQALSKHVVKHIVIGLGGSCSDDGGSGLLEALGVKFYHEQTLLTRMNNQKLCEITAMDFQDFDTLLSNCEIKVCSDVTNPLLGNKGATYVFAPQKGASEQDLVKLEENLAYFAEVMKKIRNVDASLPSTGAAGGISFGLCSHKSTKIISGIDYLLDLMNYKQLASSMDMILTGEGCFDSQSLDGKVISGIMSQTNKPVYILCGMTKIQDNPNVFPICPIVATKEESFAHPKESLIKCLEYFYDKKLV
jgi:glycerate kinase